MALFSHATKLLATLCLFVLLLAPFSHAQTTVYPKVVQNLINQGVQIKSQFTAASGLVGYAAKYQGQAVALYLTSDKQHVLIGNLIDEAGKNLTQNELQQRVIDPENTDAWQLLSRSATIIDGKKDAPVIVYAFMDPNCPYCHKFREAADPWVKAGKVQIRHITVGILGQNSIGKAATILGSTDPSAAVLENQLTFRNPGIKIDAKAQQKGIEQMQKNNRLMHNLGLTGTPSIYYLDAQDKVQLARGMPSPEQMLVVMGGALKP